MPQKYYLFDSHKEKPTEFIDRLWLLVMTY
ncbi:hypothetical protein LILPAPAWES_10 [Morganella phage vB_MmoP_Lilpapawes]|uniref:Uncharacterized protein n=1 Tax=Morganella phage vB_MmoP_Lilpapawes TaxID=2894803 RepID=A0AAE8YQL2_9CAUD|nr:hypothetical protein LILPAPAWES_10 [Morganella phage vB_MmoP_Lilpapawes]